MRRQRTDWLPWAIGVGGVVAFLGVVGVLLGGLQGGVSLPVVGTLVTDPDQAKVLALLRSRATSPNPQIAVAKWVPAKVIDLGKPRRICWLDVRFHDGESWERFSGFYDTTGSQAERFSWDEAILVVMPPESDVTVLSKAELDAQGQAIQAEQERWNAIRKREFPGL